MKLESYQVAKNQETNKKAEMEQKEKEQKAKAQKKFLKDQEMKKKQIAEYKIKKMEAEEMLANADLGDMDDYGEVDLDGEYQARDHGMGDVLDSSYMKMKQ